jgi:hypothetical protein
MNQKTRVACLFALAGFLAAPSASAQTAAPPFSRSHVGLGVAVSDAGDALVTASGSTQTAGLMTGIFIPIEVTPQFRLEPEVSFYRNASVQTADNPPGSVFQSTAASWRLGTGVFMSSSELPFVMYYGARVGYLRDTTNISSTTTSATAFVIPGFFVAPTVGGEYLLSDRLSLGAEVQVRYSRWSWRDSNGTQSQTTASTHGVLVLRFYFR